jgi:hypothetical protein
MAGFAPGAAGHSFQVQSGSRLSKVLLARTRASPFVVPESKLMVGRTRWVLNVA